MSDPDLSEAKAALEELSQDPVARILEHVTLHRSWPG